MLLQISSIVTYAKNVTGKRSNYTRPSTFVIV